jgi:uncharacterized protein (DUF58 family)
MQAVLDRTVGHLQRRIVSRAQAWMWRNERPAREPVQLHRRRVYILPTGAGLLFAAVLACMLIGSINYQLGLGYLFTFLVGAVGVVAMHRTHDNLLGLSIDCTETRPGFASKDNAGSEVGFVIRLTNPHRHTRAGLRISLDAQTLADDVHLQPGESRDVLIKLPAARRGWLAAPRLRIDTIFPLGMFRAWSYYWPAQRALVYPALSATAAPPGGLGKGAGASRSGSGQDAFSHVTPYQPGEDVRRLHWRAFARDQLALRVHEGEAGEENVFRLDSLLPDVPLEEALSRLATAVVRADQRRARFALVLGQETPVMSSGEAHRHACLARLATYGLVEADSPPERKA